MKTLIALAVVWTSCSLPILGFEKVTLTDKYFCDGITHGDINRDGKPDIVAGPFWYVGPEFKEKHEFYEAVPFPLPPSPTNSMFSFVEDFDGDGWNDILVCGRVHKHSAYWYRNPGEQLGEGKHWEKHFVFERIRGESPTLVDIDKDGTKELICHWDDRWGWVAPDPDDPTKPWKFHAISVPWKYNQFYHGTGVGDVNGDGRDDLIINDGWWEQPEKPAPLWKFHKYKFGEKGGAQMFAYDVDKDGDNDIITSLDAHGWGLAWFEQVGGDEQFKKHMIMGSREEAKGKGRTVFSQPHALAMADIDGDGAKDIIVGKRMWAHGPKGDVEPNADPVVCWFQLHNRKWGSTPRSYTWFQPHLIDAKSGVGVQIGVADLNGDGKQDILTASKLGSFFFENNNKGFVHIHGEVVKWGSLPFEDELSLEKAIEFLGGFSDFADKKKVKVTSRAGKVSYYNLIGYKEGDVRLKSGDVVVVPAVRGDLFLDRPDKKVGHKELEKKSLVDPKEGITVRGFPRITTLANSEGDTAVLGFVEGMTLLDVIAQLGGFSFEKGSITLHRDGSSPRSWNSSRVTENPKLKPGDTVTFTPSKGLDRK